MLKLSYDNFSFMLLNYYTYFKKGNVGANTSNIYRFNMNKKKIIFKNYTKFGTFVNDKGDCLHITFLSKYNF